MTKLQSYKIRKGLLSVSVRKKLEKKMPELAEICYLCSRTRPGMCSTQEALVPPPAPHKPAVKQAQGRWREEAEEFKGILGHQGHLRSYMELGADLGCCRSCLKQTPIPKSTNKKDERQPLTTSAARRQWVEI